MRAMRKVRSLGNALTISALAWQTALYAGSPEGTAHFVGPDESKFRLGVGFLSEDNHHLNRYTGPDDEGVYPYFELDLRYRGEDENDARYGRLLGRDLGIGSRSLLGRYGVQGSYGVFLEFNQRPRYYGDDFAGPHWEEGRDRLMLPSGGSTSDLKEWTREWELDTQRRKLRLGGQRHISEEWKVSAAFSREEKEGRRLHGYGSYVSPSGVQLPAPVDQRTDEFDVNAKYAGEELQAEFGYHLSMFSQLEENYFEFDDPHSLLSFEDWRHADSRKISRAPENSYHRLQGSIAYQPQRATQVHAKLSLGRAVQDDSFIEDTDYTDELNDLNNSVGNSLDGQIDTTRLGLRGTHRFTPWFRVRGGYRYDDRDDSTSELRIGESTTRVHSLTRHTVDIDGDIRLPGRNSLLFGYEYEQTARENADEKTADHSLNSRLRSHIGEDISGSIFIKMLERSGANYSGPALNNNIAALRVYHLADLSRWEMGGIGSYSVIPQLALGAEFSISEDDYNESEVGLLADQRSSYTATVDFFPDEKFSGYAFVTLEESKRDQGGQQRGLGQKENTQTLGMGVDTTLSGEERVTLGAEVIYLESETDMSVSGGANAQDYPTLSVKMTQLELSSDYRVTDNLQLGLAYFVQAFTENDWTRGAGPGSEDGYIYLGSEERDYTAHMGMATLGYNF